jgi:hypothetical protein
MRTLLIIIVLVFSAITLTGQSPFPDKDEIKQFDASKTCIVLEDNPFSEYNLTIKDAVNSYWKITPFEFIAVKDFNVRRLNPAYSFIVITQTNFEKDKTNAVYNFINLLQGKNVNKLGEMPEICAIPLSFAGASDLDYSYKLGAILLFMQRHAKMISEDPSLTGRKYLNYYNKNIPDVKNKTILIKQEDLAPEIASSDLIKRVYTHNIEIVTEDDIIKAIEDKTPNTLIFHKVGSMGKKVGGFCFKMLIGTDDSELYYYNQHKIEPDSPNALLPADLKKLEK